MVKILRKEDMLSDEQFRELVADTTEEQARNMGYPNLEVYHLEQQLSSVLGQWHKTKDEVWVREYKAVLYEMILKGFDVNKLDIQDQLPPALMPDLPPKEVLVGILESYALIAE